MKHDRPHYDKPRTGVPTAHTSGGGAHQDARPLRRRSPGAEGAGAFQEWLAEDDSETVVEARRPGRHGGWHYQRDIGWTQDGLIDGESLFLSLNASALFRDKEAVLVYELWHGGTLVATFATPLDNALAGANAWIAAQSA